MEGENSGNAISTQKTLQPTQDPGWNDPPKWAYSSTQNNCPTPTKRILNKRIAFPLSPAQSTAVNSANQIPSSPANLPPPPNAAINLTSAPHSPLVLPSDVSTKASSNEVTLNKEQILSDALANLEHVLQSHVVNKSKVEEIQKRLNIMKAAWTEDKLNNAVYEKVLNISNALREGNAEEADKIHIELMMHHSNLCAPWIPGIRHIILELRKNPE